MARNKQDEHNTVGKRRIVVGVDGSAGSLTAVAWAVAEAHRRGAELEAWYVWSIPPFTYSGPGVVPLPPTDTEQAGYNMLEEVVGGRAEEAAISVRFEVTEGRPAVILREAAADPEVAMVVVGRGGHGAKLGGLGSVSHHLAHRPSKPIVIVPPAPNTPDADLGNAEGDTDKGIIVGVDGSANAATALQWAVAEGVIRHTTVEAVLVPPPTLPDYPPGIQVSKGILEENRKAAGQVLDRTVDDVSTKEVAVTKTVEPGWAASVLVARAKAADLLVLGCRGIGAAREVFLGSTGQACAQNSPVPVVIVPADA